MVSTFIAILLFSGMPVVLYLSWYFDFTMKGLVPIDSADSSEKQHFGKTKWLVFSVIIILSLYGGYVYYRAIDIEFDKKNDGIVNPIQAGSIVVVPFSDISPNQEQSFIAQGLSEEISSILGKYSELRVAALSSSRALSDSGMDAVSIARRLKTETALTGSIRKTGDQIRVRIELLDAKNSKILWSNTYNRSFADVFELESEIARSTVNTLIDDFIETGEIENPARTSSTDAYLIYLRGREEYRKQTTESMKEARALFEQAIRLDSEYAQAYVAHADTIALLADSSRDFGVLKADIAKRLAEESLNQAFLRNQTIPESFAVQGRVFELAGEREKALSAYEQAIKLNPSLAKAHMWKYSLIRDLGDEVNALETLQKAYSLDPESVTLKYNLGIEYTRRANYADAEQLFDQINEENPELPMSYVGKANLAFNQGKLHESLGYWEKAHKISPENEAYFYSQLSILINLGLNNEVEKRVDDPSIKPLLLMNDKKYQSVLEEMAFLLEAYPDDPWVQFEAAWYNMLVGDRGKAAKLLVQVDNGLEPADKYAMPMCSPAIEIAWAYKQLGNSLEYEKILNECKRQSSKLLIAEIKELPLLYLALRIEALEEKPTAIKTLNSIIEKGFREAWMPLDPLLESINNSEEAVRVHDKLKQALTNEKELVEKTLFKATSN